MRRVGLVVNPVAGLGGRVGLGGTDGPDRLRLARSLGALPSAGLRATAALSELAARSGWSAGKESGGVAFAPAGPDGARSGTPGAGLLVVTAAGLLGADSVAAAGLAGRVVYAAGAGRDTSAADTDAAVRAVVAEGVDLLLFAGGDGTARDVLGALGGAACPVLGVPTGVKMHSAVFAVGPRAAGEVAAAWLAREGAVRLRDAEVMDRDEDALGEGRVTSRLFGWLPVPDVPVRVQQRKTGSTVPGPEAVGGIAAEVADRVGDGLLVLGPGTTTRAVAAALGADVSPAGVDVLRLRPDRPPCVVERDAGEAALLSAGPAWIALSPIGGQGFLLGRGNQQISPRVLRAAGGRERLLVLCTEQKLAALGGRPLLLDTGDDALDAELSGHLPVITGRRRTSLYRLTG
ncbi:NAD(+)/NADH kinase [Streptomyces sp. ML-6]|uniref:ATP-NAD kinase family protein n=1 Tax=Streptomyces sp. ML-6 TaxID=2982693 RepID=UPI0024BFAD7E|nr:NAD(+)/NADH kinase [Streptomyces sp. ML-6]MDK0523702.1 NAD(+)/NADH kinase [Streptomyces sp. ML-6]